MVRLSLASIAQVGVLAAAWGAQAATPTTLVIGGATSTQPLYTQEFGLFNQQNPSTLLTYTGKSSGAGQTAFLTDDPTQLGLPPGGTVDIGTSENPLSTSQISGYARTASDGPLIQVPLQGAPVTIPFNIKGVTKLTLNDDQLCGIFSGKLSNWRQVNASLSGQITVVYRSDSSGPSTVLLNHLARVCTAANSSFPLPVNVSNYFAKTFANGTVPSGAAKFLAAAPASDLQAKLIATPGSIGYIAPDYTSIAPSAAHASSLLVASLINGVNKVAYQPTVTNTALALASPGPGATNTAAPSTAAAAAQPALWIPANPQPKAGYPLVAYSTWLISSCYADKNKAAAIKLFLQDHYYNSQYVALEAKNGYALLTNATGNLFANAVTSAFVTNAKGWNLSINNPVLCKGKVGR